MGQLKNIAIKFLTCGWVDSSYIDILRQFILGKIESSRQVVRRDGYALQLARVLKYLFVHSGSSSGIHQKVHLSLSYHVHDVSKMPSEVLSITNLKINFVDLLKILGLYLLLIMFGHTIEKNLVIGILLLTIF